jgi:general secretion pathway protein C
MNEKERNKWIIRLVTGITALLVVLFIYNNWQMYESTVNLTTNLLPQNHGHSPVTKSSKGNKSVQSKGPSEKNKIPEKAKAPLYSRPTLNETEIDKLVTLNPFKISPTGPSAEDMKPKKPAERIKKPQVVNKIQPHNLKLTGTITGTIGWASICDQKKKTETFYKEGELIKDGVKLVSVRRNEVTISWNGEEEILKTKEDRKQRTTIQQNPADINTGQSDYQIQQESTNQTVTVSQNDLKNNFRNLSQLLSQMRVQAHFEKGKPAGFLISKVRKDSFVSRLGAKEGDIIRAVNGKKIDSVQKAFRLYNTLKNSKSVTMSITRNGKPVNINFAVTR